MTHKQTTSNANAIYPLHSLWFSRAYFNLSTIVRAVKSFVSAKIRASKLRQFFALYVQWMIFYALVANLWVWLLFCLFFSKFFFTSTPGFHKVRVMCIKMVNMWELFFFLDFSLVYFHLKFYMLVAFGHWTTSTTAIRTRTGIGVGVVMSYSFHFWFMQRTLSK